MPYKNWKQESRGEWQTNIADGGYLTNELIQLGCVQRIADALEKIAERLDPLWRKRTHEAIKAKEDRSRNIDAWHAILDSDHCNVIKKWIAVYFRPFKPTKEEKAAIDKCTWRIYRWMQGPGFYGPGKFGEFPPTPERKDEVRARRDSFDPATFDWTAIELTPLMRGRLDGLLERMKAGK